MTTDKPRYYTVNVTVENEDGELVAIWRSSEPFSDWILAEEAAFRVQHNASVEFDRMDE